MHARIVSRLTASVMRGMTRCTRAFVLQMSGSFVQAHFGSVNGVAAATGAVLFQLQGVPAARYSASVFKRCLRTFQTSQGSSYFCHWVSIFGGFQYFLPRYVC